MDTAKCTEHISTADVADAGLVGLPDDVLIRIVRYLDPRDTVVLGSVCRRFYGLASEDRLVWGRICESVVGAEAATSPDAWGAPSFQRLYSGLLRTYGALLAGPWRGRAQPLGSLMVAYPSPPYIVGGIVMSLRLAEPGVTVVPVFRVSYDAVLQSRGDALVTCLRGRNMLGARLRRLNPPQEVHPNALHEPEPEPQPEELLEHLWVHKGELQLSFEWEGQSSSSPAATPPGPQPAYGANNAAIVAAASAADLNPAGKLLLQQEATAHASANDMEAVVGSVSTSGRVMTSAVTATPGPAPAARPATQNPRAVHFCGFHRQQQPQHGAELTQFAFSCSGDCRQQEVEAVCRWAPAGVVKLLAAGCEGAAVGSTAAGPSGSSSCCGGDLVIDLDVLASHRLHERVRWMAMALNKLVDPNLLMEPVVYSRLASEDRWGAGYKQCNLLSVATTGQPDTGPAGADNNNTPKPASGSESGGAAAAFAAAVTSGPAAGSGTRVTAANAGRGAAAVSAGVLGTPVPIALHPLVGVWRGTYGAHGIEFLLVQQAGPQLLEACKLTGDDNVPAGQASFCVFLDKPGPHMGQRGSPFHLPAGYSSRVDVTGLLGGRTSSRGPHGSAAPARNETLILDAFEAQGRVAGSGFYDPQWISAEAIVLGCHTFGVLWHDIRSFSAFRRVELWQQVFPTSHVE